MFPSVVRTLLIATAASFAIGTSACIAQVPPATPALAGAYKLDPTHVSVTFKVLHMGLSRYTARFTKIDAKLTYDPADVTKSHVEASVDPGSIRTDYPFPDKIDFDKELAGADWFNTAQFPKASFKSTKIEPTGATTARITGDLTLLGVTKPITLEATLVGATDAHFFKKVPAIGISAVGTIDRTAFGLSKYAPAVVSPEVQIQIEAEFIHAN